MTDRASLILIIAGAVMAYSADSIYLQTMGAVVMAVGVLGLAASVLLKPTRPTAHAHLGSQAVFFPTQHNARHQTGP